MQTEQVFTRILVPVDGSFPSTVAQELAAFVAKRFSSRVTALHVATHEYLAQMASASLMPQEGEEYEPVSPGTGQTPRGIGVPKPRDSPAAQRVLDEVTQWYLSRGERIIEEASARFKEEQVPAETRLVEHGDPANVALEEAEKGKYDLIVVGNSEEIKDTHLGSVAKAILQDARVPVLVARQKTQISSVLAAVDGSAATGKVLQYADAFAYHAEAKVTLLHVLEPAPFQTQNLQDKEKGTRLLLSAAHQIHGTVPEQKLEQGDPARKILETAKQEDSDLIIVGSHGHGALRRLVLGTVSDHVVHYADRPVLLVR
ncbi:MAG: universal stress protein [Candidatus Bathyarchaeia archaeon]